MAAIDKEGYITIVERKKDIWLDTKRQNLSSSVLIFQKAVPGRSSKEIYEILIGKDIPKELTENMFK
jgi:hypothetical protein